MRAERIGLPTCNGEVGGSNPSAFRVTAKRSSVAERLNSSSLFVLTKFYAWVVRLTLSLGDKNVGHFSAENASYPCRVYCCTGRLLSVLSAKEAKHGSIPWMVGPSQNRIAYAKTILKVTRLYVSRTKISRCIAFVLFGEDMAKRKKAKPRERKTRLQEAFGRAVRSKRTEAGLSQEKLADLAGLHFT